MSVKHKIRLQIINRALKRTVSMKNDNKNMVELKDMSLYFIC